MTGKPPIAGRRAEGTYRSSPTTDEPGPPFAFAVGGVQADRASVNAIAVAVLAAPLIKWTGGHWLAWLAALVALVLAAGSRWEVRIDASGLLYTRYVAWWIPANRTHYLLDVEIGLYQAFEDDEPTGLCIESSVFSERVREECFGPSQRRAVPAMKSLRERIETALYEARAFAPPLSTELRHRWLTPLVDALDVESRGESGRVSMLAAKRPLRLGNVDLPVGTKLTMNPRASRAFVDPRRDDELAFVTVAGVTRLALRSGDPALVTRPGARLWFDDSARVDSVLHAFDGPVSFDDLPLDGDARISWDNETGRLRAGTLADAVTIGDFVVPPRSEVSSWPAFAQLDTSRGELRTFALAAALSLPELTLRAGDSLHVTSDGKLVAIRIVRDVSVGGETLRGGIAPIAVHLDGRIDRDACRASGLLVSRSR